MVSCCSAAVFHGGPRLPFILQAMRRFQDCGCTARPLSCIHAYGIYMNDPILFAQAMEKPEPDEAKTTAEMVATLMKISTTTNKDGRHALRSVHAKSHAILQGTLTVPSKLPEGLAQGLFAQAGTYPVIVRLSSTPGDLLSDTVSTPRGLAIKVIGVAGERLPGSEGAVTQDFILINGPAFAAPDAKSFLKKLKLLAGTTDKAPGLKSALATALRGAEKIVEAFGSESGTLKSLGGHPATHPLGETFFTQVPVLYGKYIAKISLAPQSPELKSLKNQHVNITHSPNALREVVVDYFRTRSAVWDVRVQLCRNLEKMPIENSATVWPEDMSPFLTVAQLTVAAQPAWSDAHSVIVDDQTSFSPWHGIAAHRPLGSIMRVRKAAYEASAQFRASHNGRAIVEPINSDALK